MSLDARPAAGTAPAAAAGFAPEVAVVGFGYIGSVIAATLADRGLKVIGIDTNAAMVAAVNGGACPIPEPGLGDLVARGVAAGRLAASVEPAAVAGARAVLITVGTPLSETFEADLSHIRAACAAVAPHVAEGAVVMIKSTVPPGTTRAMHDEVFAARGRRVHMAFSPERLAEGQAIRDLASIPILVGGMDAEASAAGAAFWRAALPEVEAMELSSPEAAEMVKLADNLWIDLNVALANELAKLVDALPYPIDVLEVIAGANSLKKGQHHVNILTPSNGVGGYCLTKDPWFVDALGRRAGVELKIPRASREVNDSMPGHVFERVDGFLKARGIAPAEARVAILGYAFKSQSGDVRFTPVAPLVERLRAAGYGPGLAVCDPMVHGEEAARQGVELTADWRAAAAGAHAVLILAGHADFAAIAPADLAAVAAPGALVFDGRIHYPRARIAEIEALGLAYRGVGR
jgi:UDP-N-acetyl-D-mannosaminuronic acid dehydrogenase